MTVNRTTQDATKTDKKTNNEQSDSVMTLFVVYLKGIAMGMADIVPGVSGGTIALITGVYSRLIDALSSVDMQIWQLWREHGLVKGLVKVWQHLDATFLLCLLLGIATSFATLAGTISHLLVAEPLKIWSLFFGLVVATVVVLSLEIKRWNWQKVVLFILGMLMALAISYASMVNLQLNTGAPSLFYLFFAGAIAICAMILPGISGSFILLLLGAYQAVLTAIHTRDITTVAVVMMGMLIGLLTFSKFLRWLLHHHYQATLALLTGFIAGSLLKIYPWKVEVDGVVHNVMPSAYPTGAEWGSSLLLMVIGAVMVFALSWVGNKKS